MYWFTYYVIIVIFILSFAYYKIRYPFVKQINEIIGPDGMPFVGMVYELYKVPRNKQIEYMDKLFKEFGPLFRTWLGPKAIVHIGNAEYAQKILSSSVNLDKSFVYNFIKPWLGTSLPVATGEEWHERRKLLTPAFHFSKLNDYIDVMVKNWRIFIERLDKVTDVGEFDIYPYIIDCSMDTIAETAMNVQLNTQKGSAKTHVENIHKLTKLVLRRLLNPLVYLDFTYSLTENHSKMKKLVADLSQISSQIVERRVAERGEQHLKASPKDRGGEKEEETFYKKKYPTFLEILLDKYYGERDGSLTLKIIKEEVDTFIFAGYDTISFAIAFTIFLVGHHPDIQDKIHAEIDAVIPDKDSLLNAQTITQMKYLEWALLDSLRLYPPAPVVARCLKEPVDLGDQIIPAGADVVIHFDQIHRSPDNFSNPTKFDPLNFSPEKVNSMHPYAFIPFSAGPRNCIGQKYARLEAKIALALFFKQYEVTSITKIEDMRLISEIVSRPQDGVRVKIKRRTL